MKDAAPRHILHVVHHKRRAHSATGRKLQLRVAGAQKAQLDTAKTAQLNELNAMVAEYEEAIDISSRESPKPFRTQKSTPRNAQNEHCILSIDNSMFPFVALLSKVIIFERLYRP